jgi:predicted anti-sigma-YlaC factor YlaD
MSRDISPVVTASATATTSPPTTLRRRWMRFTRHFLLMLAAMYLGMLTLYPAYDFLAGRAGYADATNELPIPSALGMAVAMTLPMAALMFHHRHGWRPVMEMAAAMTLPTLAATLHLTGTITADAVISVGHTATIPAMLAAMLLRFDHYAGPNAAMQQRAYQRDTAPKLGMRPALTAGGVDESTDQPRRGDHRLRRKLRQGAPART